MLSPPRLRAPFASASIFLAAFLLFALEPLVAKRILPWFGGSAAVWSTCLVFYQSALLLGYAYANSLAGRTGRRIVSLHVALLVASLLFLPIGPGPAWSNPDIGHPISRILETLLLTIGLPFILLSSTSPLLQAWTARSGNALPYRLFALSNLASLCALLAYPFLIEPALSVRTQVIAWSSLYAVYALLAVAATWLLGSKPVAPSLQTREEPQYILHGRWLSWFALAACGSMLLLAVTNHITSNVAAVPLLWILPLTIYLLTFIFAFARTRPLAPALWLRLLAVSLGALAYSIFDVNAIEAMQVSIPIFLAALYVCCYYCHGELYARRPAAASGLTSFYLAVAAGGAAGAIFVGIAAPSLFQGVYELPLALFLTASLVAFLTWQTGGWAVRVLWLGVAACMAATVVSNVHAYRKNTLSLRRSFYGSLRVVQTPHAGPEQTRTLFHGTIEHGSQYVQLPRRLLPGTYYGPQSGIGILLREYPKSPKRVAVVGLGTGTIAAFGRPGDTIRFIEINRQVIDIAQSLFTYLRESKAHVDVVEGDGRLALARDSSPPFDVIVLDAFAGDAIPVHLLTAEAMDVYRRHLQPDGVLVIHVSNDFLDLPPVVRRLADAAGFSSVLVHNSQDIDAELLASDWMLVTRNPAILNNPSVRVNTAAVDSLPALALWTDNYNNLLQILKTPHFR